MDSCRVVGPRGLYRPLDEKQGFPTNTSPLAPCQACSKAGQAGRFPARQEPKMKARVPGICQPGAWGPRPPLRVPAARNRVAMPCRSFKEKTGVQSDNSPRPRPKGGGVPLCEPTKKPPNLVKFRRRGGPSDPPQASPPYPPSAPPPWLASVSEPPHKYTLIMMYPLPFRFCAPRCARLLRTGTSRKGFSTLWRPAEAFLHSSRFHLGTPSFLVKHLSLKP